MIRYFRQERILALDNGSIGYAVYFNDAGYPETLYFGKRLSDYTDLLSTSWGCGTGLWQWL